MWDVIDAFIIMGFEHRRISGRQHLFVRGSLAIVHESVRRVGFDAHYLLQDAEVRGILEEMERALGSIDLTWYPMEPPSSRL